MALVEKNPAPDFELADETGAIRSLKEFRGKPVVLYFYPKDDTPCLLYTSPSPRDRTRSRMPSSA